MEIRKQSLFTRLSKATSRTVGRPVTFAIAVLLVAAWAITGPLFDFSNAWQLTINTVTTIVTFLMVFLIHATQNRDSEAIQIKVDEIIRCLDDADNSVLNLEELDEEDLVEMRENYLKLADRAHDALTNKGKHTTSTHPKAEVRPLKKGRRNK